MTCVDRKDLAVEMKMDLNKIHHISDSLSTYLQGKERPLGLSLISFFSRGHLLIEDLPGLGKTTLAIGIAKSLGLSFGRIQCTSDLLPTDITGLSIYNKTSGEFEFHPGPIFNNIVLCDEINRATPKTQSALLEAMEEKQVTIEGKTYKLPRLFCVIATQNPAEQFGTFPLPESQLDRFMMKISIGYSSRQAEKEILKIGSKREDIELIEPVVSQDEVYRGCRTRYPAVFMFRIRSSNTHFRSYRKHGRANISRRASRPGERLQSSIPQGPMPFSTTGISSYPRT